MSIMKQIQNIHAVNTNESYYQKTINKAIYLVALIGPIMTLPQLYEIWINKTVAGVSLLTWGAYALVSFVWILYGVIHKEKPILISQTLLLILELSIVIGVLIFR